MAEKPSYRHAWRARQLAIVPVDAFYEPCYETGKPVRWRIERDDQAPFGLAGIWEQRTRPDGSVWWSYAMLTIHADDHPLMQRIPIEAGYAQPVAGCHRAHRNFFRSEMLAVVSAKT